jgi:hypothetical protein
MKGTGAMNVSSQRLFAGILMVWWLSAGTLPAQYPDIDKNKDKKQTEKPAHSGHEATPDEAAMHEAWETAATPGPHHAHFKDMAGSWKTEIKHYHESPEPTVTSGTSEILDGRFLVEKFKGEMMGAPFQGMGVSGYDNIKKQYFVHWFDTHGTGPLVMTGQMDEGTNTLTVSGPMTMPDNSKCMMKAVTREMGKDRYVFELYMKMGDQPDMKAEIVYTR